MRAQIAKAEYAQQVQYAQVQPQWEQQWQIAAPVNAYMMSPMMSPMAQQMQYAQMQYACLLYTSPSPRDA